MSGAETRYTVSTTISGSTSALRIPSMAMRVPVRPLGQLVQAPLWVDPDQDLLLGMPASAAKAKLTIQ